MATHKVVGFELEIGSPIGLSTLRNRIRRELGITGIRVHDDYSVDTNKPYNGELVTDPLPMGTAVRNLRRILKFLTKNGVVTDRSCGFHVNMSFKKDVLNYAVDPMSVLLMVDDIKWLKTFGRSKNTYCLSPKVEMTDCIRKEARRRNITITELKQFLYHRIMMEYAETDYVRFDDEIDMGDDNHFFDKYFSINLFKLSSKKPYIEFRFLGGKNYHLRADELVTAIEDISNTLDKCIDERKYEGVKTRFVRNFLSPSQRQRIKTR